MCNAFCLRFWAVVSRKARLKYGRHRSSLVLVSRGELDHDRTDHICFVDRKSELMVACATWKILKLAVKSHSESGLSIILRSLSLVDQRVPVHVRSNLFERTADAL